MPKPNEPAGEEAAQGQETETFSREDVEALIAERDRSWKQRITPLQQERAELRRAVDRVARLEGRLEELGQLASHRGDPGSSNGHEETVDWDSIDSGEKLKRAFDAEFNRRMRAQPRQAREDQPSPTEERMEIMLLEQDIHRLKSRYTGLTDDEVRRILELSERTSNGDLNYLAYQLYGSPGEWKQGRVSHDDADDVPDENPTRRLTKQQILAGRQRAQAQGQQQAPKVKLRRGQGGYRDATKVAEEWLRSRGHS